jgi:hypothetical protein
MLLASRFHNNGCTTSTTVLVQVEVLVLPVLRVILLVRTPQIIAQVLVLVVNGMLCFYRATEDRGRTEH